MSNIPRTPDGRVDEVAFADPPGVAIYSQGLCFASVCSALPIEDVKAAMATVPTGVSSAWTLSDEKEFANGQPHPCPCEDLPETHKHYLFSC
jgi:hypothetical protein